MKSVARLTSMVIALAGPVLAACAPSEKSSSRHKPRRVVDEPAVAQICNYITI